MNEEIDKVLNRIEELKEKRQQICLQISNLIESIGGTKVYQKHLVDKFEYELSKFVKDNPKFSNYEIWYSEKYDWCMSWFIDEDIMTDEDWETINHWFDKVEDVILIRLNKKKEDWK